MASLDTVGKSWVLAVTILCMSIFCFHLCKADEDLPQTGSGGGDPTQIVARALLCFNDKYVRYPCS